MFIAAYEGKLAVVKFLISSGIPLHETNKEGKNQTSLIIIHYLYLF